MYFNKIFSAFAGLSLTLYCILDRNKLPSIYLIESILLLKFCFDASYKKDYSQLQELQLNSKTLNEKSKVELVDSIYRLGRYLKIYLRLIVFLNIVLLFYQSYTSYIPIVYSNPYVQQFNEKIESLNLMHSVIFNGIYILVCFPYLTQSYEATSKVNWQYFKVLTMFARILPLLKIVQVMLLITISFIKPYEIALGSAIFAYLIIYELSKQQYNYYINYEFSCIQRLLEYTQYILQRVIICIITLEYLNYKNFNTLEKLFDQKLTPTDQIYLIFLGLLLLLCFICNLLQTISKIEGEILKYSQMDNFIDLLIKYRINKKLQQNFNQFKTLGSFRENTDILQFDDENIQDQAIQQENPPVSDAQYVIARALISVQLLYCIFVIMRINHDVCILMIIWIFQASITRNVHIIVRNSILIYLPSFILIIINIRDKENLIFLWINITLMFCINKFYLYYQKEIMFSFNHPSEEQIDLKSKKFLIWAFILKNSYFVSLVIVFWISLCKANIIHTILLIMTIIFIVKHDDESDNNQNSFRKRRWIWMVIIINSIIILKYTYNLHTEYFVEYLKNIIEFIGLQYQYRLPFSLSFNDTDFGSLSILWILDIFVVLQYETYKSQTYLQYSQNYANIIGNLKFIDNIRIIINIVYYKLIIWICYFCILLIQIVQYFNLINFIEISLIFITFYFHIYELINKTNYYNQIKSGWSIFLNILGVTTLLRYTFDFSMLQLINIYLMKFEVYGFVYLNRNLLGLGDAQDIFMMSRLMQDILQLCLGYLGQDYFTVMQSYYNKDKQKDIELILLQDYKDNSQNNIVEDFILYSITARFPWTKKVVRFLCTLYQIVIYVMVVILSVTYKFSMTMLIYLALMFQYIYTLRQVFRKQFLQNKIESKLSESNCIQILEIIRWKFNFIKNIEKNGLHAYIVVNEDLTLINKIDQIITFIRTCTQQERRQKWKSILHFSFIFFIVTYLSQGLKYIQVLEIETQQRISYILFAIGTYSNYPENQIFYDIYPYFLAIWAVIIDIQCQEILSNQTGQDSIIQKPQIIKQKTEEEIDNNTHLINCFFDNKYELLKINMQLCLMHCLQKLYLMILFFFAAISEGIFSIIYVLLFALVFYMQQQQSKSILNLQYLIIFRITIYIVLLQYICYLITLSMDSSPREFPPNLTDHYIFINFANPQIIRTLGLDGGSECKWVFMINCFIIYGVWLFYYFQEILCARIISFIDNCYANYGHLGNKSSISAQYYILVKRVYTVGIVYFPLFVQICALLYYCTVEQNGYFLKIINFTMFVLTLLYLFYTEMNQEFKMAYQRNQFQKMFITTQQVAILLIFFVQFTLKIIQNISQRETNQVSILEILTFYILSLGRDLLESDEYKDISFQFYSNLKTRSQMIGLAMSYDANNRKLIKLINRYKVRKDLKTQVDQITTMINEWNNLEESKQFEDIFRDSIQDKDPHLTWYMYLYQWFDDNRNRFFFEPSSQIFHYLACQNLNIIQIYEHEIDNIQFENYENTLKYIVGFYHEARKFMTPEFTKEEFLQKYQLTCSQKLTKQENQHQYVDTNQIIKFWSELKKQAQNEIEADKEYWAELKQSSQINVGKLNKIDRKLLLEEVTVKRFLLVFIQFIFTYWHFFCFIILIVYNFINHGFFTICIPLAVFAYGAMEEQQPTKRLWIIIFIYTGILSILSLLEQLVPQTIKFEVLFGNQHIIYQWIILTSLIIQLNIMKNIGLYDKLINDYETIYEAIIRHLFNGGTNQKGINVFRGRIVRSKSLEDKFKRSTQRQAQRVSRQFNLTYSVLSQMETEFFDYFQRLKISHQDFFQRAFCNMKPGKDVYPIIAAFQLVIAIYIFFFYEQMISLNSTSIADIFKYSQFSGNMVIALLFQIFFILIDRYIMQFRQKKKGEEVVDLFFSGGLNTFQQQQIPVRQFKQHKISEQVSLKMKYYFQVFLLLFINIYMFYQMRKSDCSNDDGTCKYITSNIFMIVFYLLYCGYFLASAFQVKYGVNDLRIKNTLMQGHKFHNFVIFKVYRILPFLFELRTLCDWAFSETSLTLFQWIKLEEIHSLLFMAKCNSYYFSNKKVGSQMPWYNKLFLGFCCIFILLGLLFGPLFLYSPLNPTFQNDDLTGANIEVGIKINQNYYQLYVNSHVMDIHKVTNEDWTNNNMTQYKFLNNVERDSFQSIKLSPYSDNVWDISEPSLQNIKSILNAQNINTTISIITTQRFIREYTDQTQQYVSNPIDLDKNQIEKLYKQIQCNSQPENIPQFYHTYIRIDKNKAINILDDQKQSIFIHLNCTEPTRKSWSICTDEQCLSGMKYFIVSDKYSSALLGYSILGFYITIVYVAGKLARGMVSGGVELTMLQDMPNPENLLKICEAITVARVEKDLVQEELLYFQLIDLIRSPQIMKNISGSFVKQRLNVLQKNN